VQPTGAGAVDGPPEAGGEREARTQGRRPVCGGPESRARGDWREAGRVAADDDAESGTAPPSLRARVWDCCRRRLRVERESEWERKM
jgi:hypothetical protein